MRGEPLPMVGGPNGEAEVADWVEIERRWRTPAPEERIGEFRCSLWKTDAPLRTKPYRFSPTFFVVATLASFGLIALGRWVADRIRQGDSIAGQAFMVGFLLAAYGGAVVAVVASRRTERPLGEATPPPEGVPARAIACRANSSRRGRCVGWLGFEGDLMLFRGAGFDFRLRRGDFKTARSLFKAFRADGGVSLKGPKGVTEHRLFLRLGRIHGETFVPDRSLWKALEADFADWASGPPSSVPSLLPPIRPVPTALAPVRWTAFVVPPLFVGALLGFAGLVLPIEPANGKPPPSPGGLALGGALLGLTWPFLLWTSDRTGRTFAREADRAARRPTSRPGSSGDRLPPPRS